jgi:hypothetical protein
MEYIDEVYRNFPIRDQDADVRRVSDLLQAWGAPARKPLRIRVRRSLRQFAAWFAAGRRVSPTPQTAGRCCGSQAR